MLARAAAAWSTVETIRGLAADRCVGRWDAQIRIRSAAGGAGDVRSWGRTCDRRTACMCGDGLSLQGPRVLALALEELKKKVQGGGRGDRRRGCIGADAWRGELVLGVGGRGY